MYSVSIWICQNQFSRDRQGRMQDFGKGGAWGVGDKLAVRSSQVCAPGGSEGMPPKNFWNFRCIFLQFGAYFLFCPIFLFFYPYSVDEGGGGGVRPPLIGWLNITKAYLYIKVLIDRAGDDLPYINKLDMNFLHFLHDLCRVVVFNLK